MKPLPNLWPTLLVITTLLSASSGHAQLQFGPVAQPPGGSPSGPREVIAISGRIVTDQGHPVPGIELWIPIGSGPLPGSTTRKPFKTMSAFCFDNISGNFTTDDLGRYSITVEFFPDARTGLIGDERCHTQRNLITQSNINVVPSPFSPRNGEYFIRAATGPLPARRLATPSLNQNPKPASRVPGGFAPSLQR